MSDDDNTDKVSTDELLLQYEQMDIIRRRFTEEDDEFMETVSRPDVLPPCVENWYTRPKRTYDWTRSQEGHRGGNFSGSRPFGNDGGRGSHDRQWRDYNWRGGPHGGSGGGGYRGGRDYERGPQQSDYRGGRNQGYGPRPDYNAQRGGRVYYAGVRQDSGERLPKCSRGEDEPPHR